MPVHLEESWKGPHEGASERLLVRGMGSHAQMFTGFNERGIRFQRKIKLRSLARERNGVQPVLAYLAGVGGLGIGSMPSASRD